MSVSYRLSFVLLLALTLAAGCSSTRGTAPVREAGTARKPAAAKAQLGTHVVQAGDTLYKIAFENGLDYRDIAQWNGLEDPAVIRVGQRLRLSPPRAPVKPSATVTTKTSEPIRKTPVTQLAQDTEAEEALVDRWAWPVRGAVLAEFNEAAGSKGIDIGGELGHPVVAAASGRIVYAGGGLRGYGKLIIIKHNKTQLSAYAHQSRILVAEGQQVARGQKIGEMGDSDTDRVKLHFEIRLHGQPVDPLKLLAEAG